MKKESCYNVSINDEVERLKEILKNCNTYNCMDDYVFEKKRERKNINDYEIIGVDNFTALGIKVI